MAEKEKTDMEAYRDDDISAEAATDGISSVENKSARNKAGGSSPMSASAAEKLVDSAPFPSKEGKKKKKKNKKKKKKKKKKVEEGEDGSKAAIEHLSVQIHDALISWSSSFKNPPWNTEDGSTVEFEDLESQIDAVLLKWSSSVEIRARNKPGSPSSSSKIPIPDMEVTSDVKHGRDGSGMITDDLNADSGSDEEFTSDVKHGRDGSGMINDDINADSGSDEEFASDVKHRRDGSRMITDDLNADSGSDEELQADIADISGDLGEALKLSAIRNKAGGSSPMSASAAEILVDSAPFPSKEGKKKKKKNKKKKKKKKVEEGEDGSKAAIEHLSAQIHDALISWSSSFKNPPWNTEDGSTEALEDLKSQIDAVLLKWGSSVEIRPRNKAGSASSSSNTPIADSGTDEELKAKFADISRQFGQNFTVKKARNEPGIPRGTHVAQLDGASSSSDNSFLLYNKEITLKDISTDTLKIPRNFDIGYLPLPERLNPERYKMLNITLVDKKKENYNVLASYHERSDSYMLGSQWTKFKDKYGLTAGDSVFILGNPFHKDFTSGERVILTIAYVKNNGPVLEEREA